MILTFLKDLTYANVKDLLRALSKEQQERKVLHKAWQHSQELVEEVEFFLNTRMSYLIYHIVPDKTDFFIFSAVYGVCACVYLCVRARLAFGKAFASWTRQGGGACNIEQSQGGERSCSENTV